MPRDIKSEILKAVEKLSTYETIYSIRKPKNKIEHLINYRGCMISVSLRYKLAGYVPRNFLDQLRILFGKDKNVMKEYDIYGIGDKAFVTIMIAKKRIIKGIQHWKAANISLDALMYSSNTLIDDKVDELRLAVKEIKNGK